jgi:hypothetical protein
LFQSDALFYSFFGAIYRLHFQVVLSIATPDIGNQRASKVAFAIQSGSAIDLNKLFSSAGGYKYSGSIFNTLFTS